jgi:DNA-binding IclR family transcriptional regulator
MPVKRSQTAARVLKVFEEIARHQPIGVSELAQKIGVDKSATQRDIMTLADNGWIRAAPGKSTRWELTAHILTIAHMGHHGNELRERARATIEALQNECGETVLLTVPDGKQFVVIDMIESSHFLRTTAHVGLIVPAVGSATSRAILPFLSEEQQKTMLGIAPDARMKKHFDKAHELGYAISVGDVYSGSTNIAAPIFSEHEEPVGAIVLSAPSGRLKRENHAAAAALVLQAAQRISNSSKKYSKFKSR